MKSLRSYLRECEVGGGMVATPGNTVGMGNVVPPTDGVEGSEPMTIKLRKRKKRELQK